MQNERRLPAALSDYHNGPTSVTEPRVLGACLGLFAAAEALGYGPAPKIPPNFYLESLDRVVLEGLGLSPDAVCRIRAIDLLSRELQFSTSRSFVPRSFGDGVPRRRHQHKFGSRSAPRPGGGGGNSQNEISQGGLAVGLQRPGLPVIRGVTPPNALLAARLEEQRDPPRIYSTLHPTPMLRPKFARKLLTAESLHR